MNKTVVLNVVGLTSGLIGEHTPFLKKWSEKSKKALINPVLPAVTCSAQSTYLTGKWPQDHGIVGNGWYFKDECEIKFWRQSNKLVQAPKIWEIAKKKYPAFTCANMFWWYNMYSSADYSVTPRPMYPSDGRKLPDVYAWPTDLRFKLQTELGTFPLFQFWGPNASIKSTKWIADSSKLVDEWHNPTLTLIYLPHLDYGLQKFGNDFTMISKNLNEIDEVCRDLVNYYDKQGAKIILLSEYGITNVNHPIHLNRIFREKDLITIKEDLGLELLDAGASKAFAVADHQIAHVYVNDRRQVESVRKILHQTQGIELVLDEEEKKKYHIHHDRAGDFVVVADKYSWFTYYYWLNDAKAPDYARTVDIHQKPGYDPVEMFIDPTLKFPVLKVGRKLIKKKLGFRTLMNVIPLDATLIKGSHGRLTEDENHRPILISNQMELVTKKTIEPIEVSNIILSHLQNP